MQFSLFYLDAALHYAVLHIPDGLYSHYYYPSNISFYCCKVDGVNQAVKLSRDPLSYLILHYDNLSVPHLIV
jgi:hypothetical protein